MSVVLCAFRKSQEKSAEDKVDKWFERFCSFAHQIHTWYLILALYGEYGVMNGVSERSCLGFTAVSHE